MTLNFSAINSLLQTRLFTWVAKVYNTNWTQDSKATRTINKKHKLTLKEKKNPTNKMIFSFFFVQEDARRHLLSSPILLMLSEHRQPQHKLQEDEYLGRVSCISTRGNNHRGRFFNLHRWGKCLSMRLSVSRLTTTVKKSARVTYKERYIPGFTTFLLDRQK